MRQCGLLPVLRLVICNCTFISAVISVYLSVHVCVCEALFYIWNISLQR